MDNVKVTEVPNENVRMPDMTPTQAAFRMLMLWAREKMDNGEQRMSDGMVNAACMHMVAMLCSGYANETGENVLPGLIADLTTLFETYKKADMQRRANAETKQ